MTTPNYRALCAELLDWIKRASNAHVYGTQDLTARADAALNAEPKGDGEGPSERIISIAKAVQECAFTHEPDARLIGNVCAEDVADLCTAALATPPAPGPGPTFQDAIKLAEGCHDYSGGHSGAEGEAWHGAIDTVVDVLKRAAIGPWDSQTRAVYGVGSEAQAGEVAVSVAELDDQQREAVHQAVAEALGNAYDCMRVWSAWQVGTMGEDDFVLVAEDDDRVAEIADAAIEAIRAIPLPAPQAGEVEA
jgi:hypothetical protein